MRRTAIGASLLVIASLAWPGSWIASRAQVASPAAAPQAGAPRPGPLATTPGQQPATGTAKPPSGIIRGLVAAANNSRPIRGVQVNLVSAQPVIPGGVTIAARENRTVATDAEGLFEIKNLPAGRYRVTAMKTGYAQMEYGQRAWNAPGTQIEVADGQIVDRINFALQRGGVIVATVTNPRGEPLAGAHVQAMRWQFVNARRQLMPVTGVQTNDLGQARVHGLSPGEYYISVSPAFRNVGSANAKMSYAPTYYPGTLLADEAQRVPVAVAQETNVSVALIRARLATISGRATRSDGSPLVSTAGPMGGPPVGPSLALMMRQEIPGGGIMQRSLSTKPDGSFTIPDLLPGTYDLQIRPVGNLQAFKGTSEFASVPVTVGNEDVSNVTVVSQRGARVSGQITFDTGAPPADKTVEDLRVFVYSNMSEPPLSAGLVTMNPDWSFEILGVAMTGMVRLFVANTGWNVKEEIIDGQDIVESPITFEPGREYKDIRVVLTQKRAEVIGSAVDNVGRPVKEFVALLFPQDPARWVPRSLSILVARSDQNGQFRISRFPGGKYGAYNIIALDALEPGSEMDFELLARLAPLATRFTVGETEVKTVSLKVQEAP
jgi:hypothetical protein